MYAIIWGCLCSYVVDHPKQRVSKWIINGVINDSCYHDIELFDYYALTDKQQWLVNKLTCWLLFDSDKWFEC